MQLASFLLSPVESNTSSHMTSILLDTSCFLQDVLKLVRTSAADFDAVCMATALHKMASLDADPQQYKLLGDRPELSRLKEMICEMSSLTHQCHISHCPELLSVLSALSHKCKYVN